MALTPEWSLAAFAIAVILLSLFVRDRLVLALFSLAGVIVSAAVAIGFATWLSGSAMVVFGNMLVVDSFALFFKLLFLGIAALLILASLDYAPKFAESQGEYFALVLLSTLGMMLMAATTELIAIYVALELTSISLYVLVGFLKEPKASEAALKYLLLGAVASAVLLFGMAMVFGFTGQTKLGDIVLAILRLAPDNSGASPALIFGVVLLVAGFGFKIASVPFQMWVPDVYEGAPTPVTGYLSVASKAAGFAVVLRVFYSAFIVPDWVAVDWGMLFAVLAAISMTVGNVVALPQTNIKRMLGYSSIAQAGYLMVGVATVGLAPATDIVGRSSILFFLAGYALANLGAFIAIIAVSNQTNSDLIADYSGMGKRAPLLSLALTLSLVSLIGMPPAAGFIGKFYIFSGAVQHGLLWLVIIAVINSVVSAYYYMRVVKVMWFGEPASAEKVPSSAALKLALTLTTLGVLFIGIVPGYLMRLAQAASNIFVF
ncbi:MAG: NADH-quinone oxidoreductase subunit N [Chloroflexi bacterium]|nr:NADH-quinone oxidoreductase subunit N [Chloroflexota bacterium]